MNGASIGGARAGTGRKLSIVLDARMAMDGGIGTYLQQLVPRIAAAHPEWRFTAIGDREKLAGLGWGKIPGLSLSHSSAPIFSVREQAEIPALTPPGTDLFWAPNYDIPVLSRLPLVVTIHDVNHLALPELLGGAVRKAYARWMIGTAFARARRVIYDSEFTQREAIRLVPGAKPQGSVIHLGVDQRWFRARELMPARPIAEPYLLYVGNIKRHKNVPFLIRAFARVLDQVPHQLVLVGRTEGLRADPQVADAVRAAGGRAQLLGERDANEVLALVAHADAVVTASRYEGFGLPALEAMAAGTPALVSRAGSLPEICGDAALYGDAGDEAAFGRQILEIARNAELRAALVAKGAARAAQFRWDDAARRTAQVLLDAAPAGGVP